MTPAKRDPHYLDRWVRESVFLGLVVVIALLAILGLCVWVARP